MIAEIRGRLSVWITLAFLLAAALPVVLVGLAAHAKIQSDLVQEILHEHRKLIEQSSVDLLAEFETSCKQLERMAREVDVERMDPGRQRPALETFLTYNTLFHGVVVHDRAGQVVSRATRGTAREAASAIAPGANDPVGQAFARALETGRTATVPPSGEGPLEILVLTPVPSFVDGRPPVGVAVARLSLYGPEIQNLVAGWEFVGGTYLYVTDDAGKILARAGQNRPLHLRTIRVSADAKGAAVGGTATGLGTINGRDDLLASARVAALGLTVVVGKPYEEVDRFLRELVRSTAAYALMGLLLAIALGAYLARRVADPVLTLAAGIRRVASGEVAHRIPVESPDELGQAAEAFNAMATHMQRGRLIEEMWQSRPRPGQGS